MQYWLGQFHVFLLILLRISALLVVLPLFGHRHFPGRARLGLGLALSLVVFPLVVAPLGVPDSFLPYAVMMVREVTMGLLMGFAVLLLFIGVQFAGQLAGLQIGFGIVGVIDPQTNDQVEIIGQFFNILAVLLLLTTNGHHLILQALVHSFEVVPLGGVTLRPEVMQQFVALSAAVFVIAIKICAPILVSLFLISVALGILARTVPQMNVFIVGFPVQLGAGMAVLMVSLPLFYVVFTKLVQNLGRDLVVLMNLLR